MTEPTPGAAAAAATGVQAPGGAPPPSFPDTSAMTADQAQATIKIVLSDPALSRRSANPRDAEAMRWQTETYARAYPAGSVAEQILAQNAWMSVDAAEASAQALAVPATPEAYVPFDIPIGMQHRPRDAAFESEAKTMLHSAGASQAEANIIAAQFFLAAKHAPCDSATCERALGALWKDPSEFAANLARAQRVYREAKISDRLRAVIDQSGLRNSATVIATLAAIGQRRGY